MRSRIYSGFPAAAASRARLGAGPVYRRRNGARGAGRVPHMSPRRAHSDRSTNTVSPRTPRIPCRETASGSTARPDRSKASDFIESPQGKPRLQSREELRWAVDRRAYPYRRMVAQPNIGGLLAQADQPRTTQRKWLNRHDPATGVARQGNALG